MSFSFNDIKYGWKIITGVVITGATIFVADNTRQQILQRDTIQPILGTHERCLSAGVAPLEFVRSWYSNAYDGTNAVLYTNIVTNAIGWRVDRGMLVDLDAKIEELAPYFADTNTVYDGTTNIVMNTFTGLLTSLDIGDHTNFTSYGWYVSQDDLRERCKFLYSLTKTAESGVFVGMHRGSGYPYTRISNYWEEMKSNVENYYLTTNSSFGGQCDDITRTGELNGITIISQSFDNDNGSNYGFWGARLEGTELRQIYLNSIATTAIEHKVSYYYKCATTVFVAVWCDSTPGGMCKLEFNDNGTGLKNNNAWNILVEESGYSFNSTGNVFCSIGVGDNDIPVWCNSPEWGEGTYIGEDFSSSEWPAWFKAKGVNIPATNLQTFVSWNFNYCTNALP